VVPLVSFVTPRLSDAHVEDAFSCYDEKINAPHKFVLNEEAE